MARTNAWAVIAGLAAAAACAAQPATTQPIEPATQSAPASTQPTSIDAGVADYHERLEALVALIELPTNPPATRITGVKELLAQGWPETTLRLRAILSGTNNPARAAVARVLAESPAHHDPAYLGPLLDMLGDADAEVRAAAAEALAAYRDGGVVLRLRGRVQDATAPPAARQGAVAALGLMTDREAINALAELLGDPDPTFARAALVALENATGIEFAGDVSAARDWWERTRPLSDDRWQVLQIERLVKKDRRLRGRLEATETRLIKVLEANFQRAAETERGTLLATYLADEAGSVRLLGLRLAQAQIAEGRTLPPDLVARLRGLLSTDEPRERAAAIRAVASLRDPQDGATFIAMLATARDPEIRLALINGLGYVGNGPATRELLAVLQGATDETLTEAIAALGRLAERNALHADSRPQVIKALHDVFARTNAAQVALRERTVWAMGKVVDPSFGPAFAAALSPSEAVAVRQAAARGIGILNDPKLADTLVASVADPDAAVRKTAIETLGALGSTDKHVGALWSRLTSPPETDESLRQAAWRALLAVLPKLAPQQIDTWLDRLEGDETQRAQRALEVLLHVAARLEAASPVPAERLGEVRARIGHRYVELGQPAEAQAAFAQALSYLHGTPGGSAIAVELLRVALRNGRYDAAVAAALVQGNPGPDYAALLAVVRAEVEARLTPERADESLALLKAVLDNPPGAWPADAAAELADLRARATALKPPPAPKPAPAPAVESKVAQPVTPTEPKPAEREVSPILAPSTTQPGTGG